MSGWTGVDPNPEYSRLDRMDGLPRMTSTDASALLDAARERRMERQKYAAELNGDTPSPVADVTPELRPIPLWLVIGAGTFGAVVMLVCGWAILTAGMEGAL